MGWRWNENKRAGADGLGGERTNGDRAMAGEAGVERAFEYREPFTAFEEGSVTNEEGIVDLLADIGHLCDREGLDFNALVETAKLNWGMER